MSEQWRPIQEVEGVYEVSSLGRVRNLRSGKILRTTLMSTGYPQVTLAVNGNHYRRKVHRLMVIAFGVVSGNQETDHINGDRADNRLENLRGASESQNQANAILKPHSTSRYRGVCRFKRSSRWYARIKLNGKEKILGSYPDEQTAAREYDRAAKALFGDYARLNFPVPREGRGEGEK